MALKGWIDFTLAFFVAFCKRHLEVSRFGEKLRIMTAFGSWIL